MKKEAKILGAVALFLLVFLKIAFYREDALTTIRMASSVVWLFLLPGYAIMLWWAEEIAFLERLIMGSLLSAGIMGAASYYAGLLGLHVQLHALVLPPVFIVAGIIAWIAKQKKAEKLQES